MKKLHYISGFITGAVFVFLFLYLPLKEETEREDRVLDKALKILDSVGKRDEFEAVTSQRRNRLSQPVIENDVTVIPPDVSADSPH